MNKAITEHAVVVVGMPHDQNSSFLRGAAKAPAAIAAMRESDHANTYTEFGLELAGHPKLIEAGNISWRNGDEAFSELEATINDICGAGAKPMTIGGDHAITYPIVKALSAHHAGLNILHFDAHPDLYDSLDGNPMSHACPFARIMEAGLATRLVQVGIRTLNQHQREQVDRFDVEVHEMKDWRGPEQLTLDGPLYISVDLDALDPAYAPGVSHHEPGGFTTRQVLDVIHSIQVPIVGADIVELNPDRDVNGMTAMVATKLFKEICGKMLSG